MRICGDEFIEGGTTIEEAVEVARMVEATGQVDYINTSIGVATASLYMIEASMHIPPGYAMFIPSAIRKAVDALSLVVQKIGAAVYQQTPPAGPEAGSGQPEPDAAPEENK